MKISIIGPGAMGLLFGAYLSQENEVSLIGSNPENMAAINAEGVRIQETDGSEQIYHPYACTDSSELGPADLVILFVKAGATEAALQAHRHLIGPDTLLMTLQNGAGHEQLLRQFTDDAHILIGTTQQGSYRLTPISACHSGKGDTAFGVLSGDSMQFSWLADLFTACGFPCSPNPQIRGMIWSKLMINASSSVLSGIFQVPQGYVISNPDAWTLARQLITELCSVASADGFPFDAEEQIARIHKHLSLAPDGYTSIYADLKAGRKTEIDVINGAVIRTAERLGISVPTHQFVYHTVRALESRS